MTLNPRVVLLALLFASFARAQTDEGQPIEDGSYNVDAAAGPISGSPRVIGLGGALVAIAEGASSDAVNPASVAVRLPHSWSALDYNRSLGVAIGAWLPENDYLNSRKADGEVEVEQGSLLFASLAANVYYLHAGAGVAAEGRRQDFRRNDTTAGLSPQKLTGNFGVVHAAMGYGLFDGQLVVGAGPRLTGFSISAKKGGSTLLSVAGIGYEGGVVFKPHHEPFRLGMTLRSPVAPRSGSRDQVDLDQDNSLWLPERIRLPWEASFGFAYQFGPRPLNPPFVSATDDGDRHKSEAALEKSYFRRPRRYLLLCTEMLLIGSASDSVGLSSFVEGRVRRSGQNAAWSPRIGVEAEVVPHWLQLRAGSYIEPARLSASSARVHGTFGFTVKTFSWDVFGLLDPFDGWTVSAAVDAADNYFNTALGIGIWH